MVANPPVPTQLTKWKPLAGRALTGAALAWKLTVCPALPLMVPLAPLTKSTLKVWVAEQGAVVPPFWPVQLQLQRPVPVTPAGVPAAQKLAVGTAAKLPPLLVPQSPLTGSAAKLAITVQSALIAVVV